MDSSTITVHWHDENQPVYSVDFQPQAGCNKSPRLVTGGGDNNVRIWKLNYNSPDPSSEPSSENITVEYLSTLRKHTQAVNVVRFDPKGEVLATAGDDGTLILWTLSDSIVKEFGSEDDEDKESWVVKHIYRSSTSEIYDLSWSPDSKYIATGSMDNITRIYDTITGQQVSQLAEHNHYVQGVAWDPRNEFLATQSADRSVHIYSLKHSSPTNNNEISLIPTSFFKIVKADMPNTKISLSDLRKRPEEFDFPDRTPSLSNSTSVSSSSLSSVISYNPGNDSVQLPDDIVSVPTTPMNPPANNFVHNVSQSPTQTHKKLLSNETLPAVRPMSISPRNFEKRTTFLYHSETLQSFFRRLGFSPDGSLLLTPLGIYRDAATDAKYDNNEENSNTVFVYIRSGFNKAPICHIPGLKKPAIAIAFSPIIYRLNDDIDDSKPVFKLPYKMMFAVATQDAIVVYDTQNFEPFGMVTNLHYSTITDLCWNKDGGSIIISSADGFCSIVVFKSGIFGEKYIAAPTKSVPKTETPKAEAVNDISNLIKKKKPKTPAKEAVKTEELKEVKPQELKEVKTEEQKLLEGEERKQTLKVEGSEGHIKNILAQMQQKNEKGTPVVPSQENVGEKRATEEPKQGSSFIDQFKASVEESDETTASESERQKKKRKIAPTLLTNHEST